MPASRRRRSRVPAHRPEQASPASHAGADPDDPTADRAQLAAAPAADAAAKRRRASTRRADLNRELVVELRALRASLREMIGRYELRVGGHIAELIQRMDGDPSIGATARPFATKVAHAMLAEIRSSKLKPRKARAKDFARLEELVDDLAGDADR